MIPCRPNQQPQANAAAPRAVSGQHSSPSSPSSGAARASAGEALFWCLLGEKICDEMCEVICEVLNDDVDADDADDAARGAGALTASAASTLKGRRAEGAAAPVADADADAERPCELPHVASAASPWVAACADLLEAAKDLTNMRGLRKSLTSCGFRCGPEQGRSGDYYAITVPPDFPCYYDLVGKEYAARDYVFGLATLRKYLDGALALAGTGGAYRTDAEYKRDRSIVGPSLGPRDARGCFPCPAGCPLVPVSNSTLRTRSHRWIPSSGASMASGMARINWTSSPLFHRHRERE